MKSKWILHLDADCFYVSCERLRFDGLRNKPVGVLGNQGACVIAKSYEMKARGVKTGEAIWESKEKCPDAIYIKRDFAWYESVSQKLFQYMLTIADKVEYYSIDEFFAKISSYFIEKNGGLQETAQYIQKEILRNIGIPVSVGISPTKSISKFFSDACKPYGIVTGDAQVFAKMFTLGKLDEIWGFSQRRVLTLKSHRIFTIGDFLNTSPSKIHSLLGIVGQRIWYELQGVPSLEIADERAQKKNISRGGSLGLARGNNKTMIHSFIVRTVDRLVDTLLRHHLKTRLLTLEIVGKYQSYSSSYAPIESTSSESLVYEVTQKLFEEIYSPFEAYSHLHLIASKFETTEEQISLWGDEYEKTTSQSKQDRAWEACREKFGVHTVSRGSSLPLREVYIDTASKMEICDIDGKQCF